MIAVIGVKKIHVGDLNEKTISSLFGVNAGILIYIFNMYIIHL